MNTRRNGGFTIVELLIVIVVIGILAAISIVAYNGIQQRSRDTIRRDAATKLVKAYQLWMADTGKTPLEIGAGWSDSGTGFLQYTDATNYSAPSATGVLVAAKYLPPSFDASIPRQGAWANSSDRTFMVHGCSSSRKVIVLWHLEAPTPAELAQADAAMTDCNPSATELQYDEYYMKNGQVLSW